MNNKYLNEVRDMNRTYERLLRQMKDHGFDETLFLLSLAHKSFTQDIFNQIKRTNNPFH